MHLKESVFGGGHYYRHTIGSKIAGSVPLAEAMPLRFRVSCGLMLAAVLVLFPLASLSAEDTANRVTILYDAFGKAHR